MPVVCPVCKKPNPSGLQTCLHCGAVLPASKPAESVADSVAQVAEQPSSEGGVTSRKAATEESKRDPAEYLAMLASGKSQEWVPASQLRLWGWITVLVPLVGLVAGLIWLLRRQRGAGCVLGVALFINALYAVFGLVTAFSVSESGAAASVAAHLRGLYLAEQAYYSKHGTYADFEELQDEHLISTEFGFAVEDDRNAADASGARYFLEWFAEDKFSIVARHPKMRGALRIDQSKAMRSEAGSGGMEEPTGPAIG